MADRFYRFDATELLIVLLIAYWATFGGGCEDIQPHDHTIGEVTRG